MASTVYGSAKLATTAVEDVAPRFASHNGMLMAVNEGDDGKGVFWWPFRQQGHALTFGATRSGKGVSTIIPALLTYQGSMLCIDPKAENAWVTIPQRQALGHRVVILDPWDEMSRRYAGGQQVEPVTRFNPLAALNPKSPDFGDEVAAVADALITATGGDSHWTDSARELIGGLIAGFVEARPGKATLRDVRGALLASQEDFARVIAFFEKTTPDGLGCRKLAGYKQGSREVDSIRSAAKTQTGFLDSDKLCASLDGQEEVFDLEELATGRVTLYLVLPLDRLQTHGRWLRLLLTLAIRAIARQAEPPTLPVLFMLDEMGTIGRLAMIEQAFGLMAGVGIRIWGFLQDLNQLKRDYSESWETFIANTAVITVLNARDITTSEYFSQYMGTMTIERVSKNTVQQRVETNKKLAEQRGLIGDMFHDKPSVYEPEQTFSRPLMFADEIRRMPKDHVILFLAGDYPAYLKRISYHQDVWFEELFRGLPAFPRPVKKIRSMTQARETIKAAGHVVKNKMLGGAVITNPHTGEATTLNDGDEAAWMAYAQALVVS